ncbi:FecR family protein [Flavobacterium procerum]|uniref:FecR family protein n=1 Tax=Flavobacterium procerum TaxID=1455569 RepID=A0ABV6BLD8_9FLAO
MTVKKSEQLIVKFITNQASKDEIEELTEWLKEDENQIVFKDFVKTNYAIDTVMNNFDSAEVRKQLSEKMEQENNVFYKRRFSSYYKYAAILIVALGGFYFYKNSNNLTASKQNTVIPREDAIVLQSGNKFSQDIDSSEIKNITDSDGNIIGKLEKNRLVYVHSLTNGKAVYNTLRIPYGKKFEVQLSDGTIVYLNAGTSLTYPVQFLENQNRQVSLTGEAYFEVSKDKQHPFTVNTQEVNVEVLGTKFNVNTYNESISTDVVLVEGKVSLYKDDKEKVFLKPGFKGSNLKGQTSITTEQVNTDYYTDWVKGSLVFKNESFGQIIRKLERHYNVTFINQNKMLEKEVFNARFDNEPIEVVLKYFSDSYKIDYDIDRDKIRIK